MAIDSFYELLLSHIIGDGDKLFPCENSCCHPATGTNPLFWLEKFVISKLTWISKKLV